MTARKIEKPRICRKCGLTFTMTAKGIADHAATCNAMMADKAGAHK